MRRGFEPFTWLPDILGSPDPFGGCALRSNERGRISSAPGGRVTKAERKEQARRERVELQRRMARSKRNRRLSLVVVLAVAVGAATFALTRPSTAIATPGELFRAAADAKRSAGCGAVEVVGAYQPEDQDRIHITSVGQMPPLSTYPSVPPASGPHNQVTMSAGVYTSAPSIDRVIHSLEHGAAVIWYAPDASGQELDRLRAFFDESSAGDRVIVAPYDYPDRGDAGRLPAGTQMALVAWHHVETCPRVSLAAAFDFSAKYGAPPFGQRTYLGDAPEAGVAF